MDQPDPEEFNYFTKAISELVETKGHLCHSKLLGTEEGMELFRKQFDIFVLKPCNVFNEAYESSFDEFLKLAQESPELAERIKSTNEQEYDWLSNASVCRKIVTDFNTMRNSFFHVLCLRMLGH